MHINSVRTEKFSENKQESDNIIPTYLNFGQVLTFALSQFFQNYPQCRRSQCL